jgi:Tfp pilus assembly ATPase PilU
MSSYDITDLLTLVTTDRAEGLSLHTGEQPIVHLGGEPHPIKGPPITTENAETLLRSLATTRQVRELREHRAAEFIYTFGGSTQFRVQARIQHDQVQLELQRLAA